MSGNVFCIVFINLLWNLVICNGQTTGSPCDSTECFLDWDKIDATLTFTISENSTCYSKWSYLTDFNCPTYYQMQGAPTTSFCDPAEYTWQPDVYMIKCKAPCDVPAELSTNVTISGSRTSNETSIFMHGEIITYSCRIGTLIPFSTTSCNDGNWENADIPMCMAGCDFPPNTKSASPNVSPVSHGEVVTLECQDGFQSSSSTPSPIVVACDNGEFSKSLVCTEIYETTQQMQPTSSSLPISVATVTGLPFSSAPSKALSTLSISTKDASSMLPTVSLTQSSARPTTIRTTEDITSILPTESSTSSLISPTVISTTEDGIRTVFSSPLTKITSFSTTEDYTTRRSVTSPRVPSSLYTTVITKDDGSSIGTKASSTQSSTLFKTLGTTRDDSSIAPIASSTLFSTSPNTVTTTKENSTGESTASLSSPSTSLTSVITTKDDNNMKPTESSTQSSTTLQTAKTTKEDTSFASTAFSVPNSTSLPTMKTTEGDITDETTVPSTFVTTFVTTDNETYIESTILTTQDSTGVSTASTSEDGTSTIPIDVSSTPSSSITSQLVTTKELQGTSNVHTLSTPPSDKTLQSTREVTSTLPGTSSTPFSALSTNLRTTEDDTSVQPTILSTVSTISPTTVTTKLYETSMLTTVPSIPSSTFVTTVNTTEDGISIVPTVSMTSFSTLLTAAKTTEDQSNTLSTPSTSSSTQVSTIRTTAEDDTSIAPTTSSTLLSTLFTNIRTKEGDTPMLPTVSSTQLSTTAISTENNLLTSPLDVSTQSSMKTTETLPVTLVTDKVVSTYPPSNCDPPEVEKPLMYKPYKRTYEEFEEIEYYCEGNLQLVGNQYAICESQQFYPSEQPICAEIGCNGPQCEALNGYCNEKDVCVCKPGYSRLDKECVEIYPIKTTISLNATWNEVYSNRDSPEFRELEADVCVAIESAFKDSGIITDGSFLACMVISFKEGSIQVAVSTTFTRKSKVTPANVESILLKTANSSEEGYTLPGMMYNLTKSAPIKSNELNSCEDGVNDCDEAFGICTYKEEGSYSCTCMKDFVNREGVAVDGVSCVPGNNLGLVIGVSVAAGLFLASIVSCFILCLKISCNRRVHFVTKYYPDETSNSSINYSVEDETDFDDVDLDHRMSRIAQEIQHMNNISPIPNRATVDPLTRPDRVIDPAEEALPQGGNYYGKEFHNRAFNSEAAAYQ